MFDKRYPKIEQQLSDMWRNVLSTNPLAPTPQRNRKKLAGATFAGAQEGQTN